MGKYRKNLAQIESMLFRIELLSECNWLPITCVVTFLMAVNMGHSTLPLIFLSEFYPASVRCVWSGLTLTLAHTELILLSLVYPRSGHKYYDLFTTTLENLGRFTKIRCEFS